VPTRAKAEPQAPAPPQERFAVELEALGGHPHSVASPADAITLVVDICTRHACSRVLAWDESAVGLPGLVSRLADAGFVYDTGWLPPDAPARTERLADLESIRVGITGALGGLVDCGGIVVTSGPGRSRLASLLPPVHIAVLRSSRLYASLPPFLAAHPSVADQGSNLVFITGPSRTADIEMTLTRGVHGPGEVHVVVVDDTSE
jgi:L-lactate dehydrogenase complex protein LldG